MSNERKTIEEMTADTEKPVRDRKNWVAFVESDAVNFMTLKMNVEFEEGQDPKAVMAQVRTNCKKVEDDCEIFL